MATETVRVYDRPLSTRYLMARAGVTGIPGLSSITRPRHGSDALPNLVLRCLNQAIDLDRLTAYNRVCGFGLKASLPVTYPHILAFGLHLALMTDRSFPFPLLGLVHINNSITQSQPLQTSERLDLHVRAANLRPHRRGQQFDVMTSATVAGSVVWEEVTTLLSRGEAQPAGSDSRPDPPPVGHIQWRLPADLGRRYAAVSGDYNPIHLYGITARAFGFSHPIVHGMWSLARCLAQLEGRLPSGCTVEAVFRKPILLPATVAFASGTQNETLRFALADARRGGPHLSGTINVAAA